MPHAPHAADPAGIDLRERLLFVMLDDAEVDVLLDVRLAAGQLQPGMPVCIGVDVTRRPHGKQAREELHAGRCGRGDLAEQPVAVGERNGLAELAPRDVERRAVEPPLRVRRLGELRQGVRGVFPRVVDVKVFRGDDFADLPVGRLHLSVQVRHDERGVFARGCREHDDGVVLSVCRIDHQRLCGQPLDAVQLQGVGPLLAGVHLWPVALRCPVAGTFEFHVVVDLDRHAFECRERHRQQALLLDAACGAGVVVGRRRHA